MALDSRGYQKNRTVEPVRDESGSIVYPIQFYDRPVTKEDKERRIRGLVPKWYREVRALKILHGESAAHLEQSRDILQERINYYRAITI